MNVRASILAAALAGLPGLAFAQPTHQHGHAMPGQAMPGHAMPGHAITANESAATKGYREANARMHQAMEIPFTNDADGDFVRSMIPHHQGAIDMAKVALQHANDEQVRRWAADVIREQEREIAAMRDWLKTHIAQ
jgi:uncharacterized protein (DUF305 family)